jgi:hypothetical protein
MSRMVEQVNVRIVPLLLLLGLLSVCFLWTLNPVSQTSEAMFALFLSVDLVSFSMISYLYRVDKRGDSASRGLLLAGCCMILLLLLAGLFL